MRYSRLSASFIFIAEDTRAHTHTLKRKMENNTQGYMCVDSLRRKKGKKKKRVVASLCCLRRHYWRRLADCTWWILPPKTPPTIFFHPEQGPMRPNFSPANTMRVRASLFLFACVLPSLDPSVAPKDRHAFRNWRFGKDYERRTVVFSLFFFFFFNSFSRFIHYWNKRVSPLEKKSRPERNKNKKEKKTPTFLSSCSNWIPNSLPPTNPPLFSSSLSEKLSFSLTSHRTLCKS